jgi:hypothetical protein
LRVVRERRAVARSCYTLALFPGEFTQYPGPLGWRRTVSPILVRPVREQLEHDRVIRLLQTKLKRRYEVGVNVGAEQATPVGSGTAAIYPDVVLSSLERGKRLQAVVEVETGESVNHLEALAQWAHLARLRAAFFLYVPSGMVDVARRLCEDNQIRVNEIWSFHSVGDEVRFTLVHRNRDAAPPTARPRVQTHTSSPRKARTANAKRVPRGKPARVRRAKKPARAQKRK